MSQSQRYNCNRCGQSIFHAHVNGQRIPLVTYVVVGQPEDTGPPVDLSAVAVPQWIRELLVAPTPRLTLCIACVAIVFRTPVVPATVEADPLAIGPNAQGVVVPLPVDADRAMRTAALTARAVRALELPAPAVAEASGVMSGSTGVALPMADRGWAGAPPPAPAPGTKARRGTATKPPVRTAVTPWMAALAEQVPLDVTPLAPAAPATLEPGQ